MVVEWIVKLLIGTGLFFYFGTAVGILRFPDFYTRMHAAGKGDTLSTFLILIGLAVLNVHEHHLSVTTALVSVKILIICMFIYIGSPTATHALTLAAHRMGLDYWRPEKK